MQISRSDELVGALQACRRHIATAAVFSLAINVLHLAAPLYMMQVYDRVMSSGSGMTLAMLTFMVLAAFGALAGIDRARASVLAAASARIDRLLAGRAFAAMMLEAGRTGSRQQIALRDLDVCRQFIGGHGMSALLDLPWIPLFALFAFSLHWAIGAFTLLCAAILVGLAVFSEMRVRTLSQTALLRAGSAQAWAEASLRNVAAVQAMSMLPGLVRRWSIERGQAATQQHALAQRTAALTSVVRFLRMSMQSLVLGLGAWLVIERAASPGAIFASSLLLGRALQPVEQVIGQWHSMLAARAAFQRLEALLNGTAATRAARANPPRPKDTRLVADNVTFQAPGRPEPILEGLSFAIEPGESIGLIGRSGAGKSTLVRLLVGATAPTGGSIQFGGIEMASLAGQWNRSLVGYMPQEIELFDDTVAANIARFTPDSDREVGRAAEIAGAHELIMGLPDGYRCRLGAGGTVLSGGMRQRIALARAVFAEPRLVVLDEPSANLDRVGDAILERCLRHLQASGTTIIVISHRPVTTQLMSKFLVLIEGKLGAFGSRAEVVHRLSGGRPGAAAEPGAPGPQILQRVAS